MPKRIQRRRTKGWTMPENAVYVGRPTRWGNPFVVGSVDTTVPGWTRELSPQLVRDAAHAVRLFTGISLTYMDAKELRGKDLACWCPLDQPCHADVLLEWANA